VATAYIIRSGCRLHYTPQLPHDAQQLPTLYSLPKQGGLGAV